MFSILKRNGLKPYRVKTFKVSRDPRSRLKVRDVVGLHVNPPDHAVVISVDEKTRIQALGRTQTPLSLKRGHPETHDYKRNGTNCRMADLDRAIGKVTGQTVERHRSQDFLAFLDRTTGPIEPGAPVHVIRGNVSSRKSADANEWLKDRPDRRHHFTPTSASWMIAVEALPSKR